jgi:hypothetical protein
MADSPILVASLNKALAVLPRLRTDVTLAKAIRVFAKRIIGDGGKCPCCGRWGKINAHNLNADPVRALIWLVNAAGPKRKWIDVPATAPRGLLRSKKMSVLKHWGLIERRKNENSKIKSSGVWRPTRLGVEFVAGCVRVAKKVYVFDDTKIQESAETITVQEALSKKFDYDKVMQDSWLQHIENQESLWPGN